ncbi:hypothetical protein [Streptomyces sp. NPDC058304]|uniref:hypothetical protein n=1 Tax=Streptomyces sp. NPDC058304 TaxID=3346437 RepID=UPI0036E7A845
MRKLSRGLAAAAMAAAALGFHGTATAATSGEATVSGWPTGCSYGEFDNGSYATCKNSHGGSYRATVICWPYAGGPLVVHDATAWKTSGLSYAFCPPMTKYSSAGIDERSHR